MSRFKRLKERKKKQYIKTIMSSLALTITIGFSQTMTTYAWFTDAENIQNDLIVTMGKLDVKIGNGLNVENLGTENSGESIFRISNLGSLKQKINLRFSKSELNTLESKHFKHIDYKLDIKTSGGEAIGRREINDNEVELINANGSRLILGPGEYLDCKSTIKIKGGITEEQKKLLSNKVINFNITALASQTNYINGELDNNQVGFTDNDIQENNIKIGELTNCQDLPDNLEVEFDEDQTDIIEVEIPDIYEDTKKLKLTDVSILGGTGQFDGVQVEIDGNKPNVDSDDFKIVKINMENFDPSKIGSCFTDNQKLKVRLVFEHDGIRVIEFWEIKFRTVIKNNKVKLKAHYVVIDREREQVVIEENEVPSEPEVVEPPREEVEVPSEPEIVEPPKEEVEVPSEPEVVEPPKEEVEVPSEPEVVEPPKEEVVIPNQPDIVAPSKEETEIQE